MRRELSELERGSPQSRRSGDLNRYQSSQLIEQYNTQRNSQATPEASGLSWADLLRAERTELKAEVVGQGSPAVSHPRQTSPGACGKPATTSGACLIQASGPAEDAMQNPGGVVASPLPSTRRTRIVGFQKLKSLLVPVHRYFADKIGFIKHFSVYEDVSNDLAYPQVRVAHRDNPYRRRQLNNKASARTFKAIRHFAEAQGLDDFEVVSPVLTMPKFVSRYLAEHQSGRAIAWQIFKAWWAEDLPAVIGQQIDLAAHVNLHLWRTEKPTEPHFHFHVLMPNYGLVDDERYQDDAGEGVRLFARWKWHRQRGGRLVPFSDEQLTTLKQLWADRMERWCKRHGLTDEWKRHIEATMARHGTDYTREKLVNVYVDVADTWVKLHHKLNYNGRHWSENYAEYSNEHPECDDPPEWLEHYDNKARVFGWWTNLSGMFKLDDEKEKTSPYTGESMKYVDRFHISMVLHRAEETGGLANVEFIRGKAVENDLTADDVKWLKEVSWHTGAFEPLETEAT